MINKEFLGKFSKEDFFQIARRIDNEYNGTKDIFTFDRQSDYYLLNTNKCDSASIIQIYHNGVIKRLGIDTDGYQEIQVLTYESINRWILDG